MTRSNLLKLGGLLFLCALTACGGGGGGGTPPADVTPPGVYAVTPDIDAVDVDADTVVSATFDESVAAGTITSGSFVLENGGTAVSGTVSYDAGAMTATFTPDSSLAAGTTYTATLDTGITDLAGNAMAASYTWSFTTGSAATQWQQVGGQVSPGGGLAAYAQDPSMMVMSGVPYVGYRYDGSKAYLQSYGGTDWGTQLGGGDPTGGNVSAFYHGPDFTAGSGAIYMAYSHAGDGSASDVSFFDRVFVMRWTSGGGWYTMNNGLHISSHGTQLANGIDDAQEPAIAFDATSGNPITVWVEGDSFADPDVEESLWGAEVEPLAVNRDGPNNRDTTSGSYYTTAENVGVTVDSTGMVYTAQWENDANNQDRSNLFVTAHNGTGFVNLGGIVASDYSMGNDLARPTIAADGSGNVYIAYTTMAAGEMTRSLYVSYWNGASWSVLGGGPVSAFSPTNHYDSENPDLILQDDRLILAWSESDQYSGYSIFVAYWNLNNAATTGFSIIGNSIDVDRAREALDPSLAYSESDDYLYVAFEEYVDGTAQIFVKRRQIDTTLLP